MRPFAFVRMATIAALSGSLLPIVAQADSERDILAYFIRGVARAPAGQPAPISASAVWAVLSRFNVSAGSIISAFPSFREADTLQVTGEGRAISMPNLGRIFRIRVDLKTQRDQLIESLKQIPEVLFAEPDGLAGIDAVPTDELFPAQWALQPGGRIQAPEAWDIFTGSSSTKIAVIDGGVDATHPDLSGKVSGHTALYGYHGTHVAGIAAAKTNNLIGVAGVNWNAQILAKTFGDAEESGDAWLNQIVTEAVNQGSHVLNCSWKYIAPL